MEEVNGTDLLEKVESMKVLEVKDGDALVVMLKGRSNAEQVESISDNLRQALSLSENTKILVFDEGTDVGIIRRS